MGHSASVYSTTNPKEVEIVRPIKFQLLFRASVSRQILVASHLKIQKWQIWVNIKKTNQFYNYINHMYCRDLLENRRIKASYRPGIIECRDKGNCWNNSQQTWRARIQAFNCLRFRGNLVNLFGRRKFNQKVIKIIWKWLILIEMGHHNFKEILSDFLP